MNIDNFVEYFQSDLTNILALAVFSFALAILLTPIYTKVAYEKRWWKRQRTASTTGEKAKIYHKMHAEKHKRNIPTMAGMIMVLAIVVTTLLFNLSRSQTYLPMAAMLGAGLVGLFDDYLNLISDGKGIAGLNTKFKFILVTTVAILGGLYFYYKLGYDTINLTFVGDISVGWLLIPLFTLVVVATANAVNITDGLDGLSGGLLVSAFSAYAAIALLQGNVGIAGFCLTIVGALLAYVWFNIYPARFFMGDIGSFALGTALGVVAMLTDTIPLLIVIGGIFVLEAGSSAIQILSKKYRGKKIFRSAPIHHHFESIGWPETKVTMRFWILGQVLGVLGIILAILGGHI
jgi:phospho-N-acetylmuramoyl-pentapeptide-transferase